MNLRAAQAFIGKLRQLSPERIAEVESYVEFLIARQTAGHGFVSAPLLPGAPFDALSGAQMEQIDSEMQASRAGGAGRPL